jgi:hypothetical protein
MQHTTLFSVFPIRTLCNTGYAMEVMNWIDTYKNVVNALIPCCGDLLNAINSSGVILV